ncbi:MAG: relaxase/mobilization nuclease domain-containing protein [Pseudomonadota bacterium]
MNPAIPETKGGVGTSFKGTAQYLLHDIDAASDERVTWTHTRNLAVDDPYFAWRIMAATAKDADRIKRQHHETEQSALPQNERVSYRSSKQSFNHVFHYALTWHPEEGVALSREQMIRSAEDSLKALGGDDLQALIVCHQDTAHPHIHIMVNRIHPETGKTVPVESNAQKKLSALALQYDRERGFTYAPQREMNARKRELSIPYQAEKRASRHIYEQMREVGEAVEAAPDRAEALRRDQTASDRALSRQQRDQYDRHHKASAELSFAHKRRKAYIAADADHAKAEAKRIVGAAYDQRLQAHLETAQAEIKQLREAEASTLGRLQEHLRAFRVAWRVSDGENFRGRVAETFKGFGGEGYAETVLRKKQKKDEQQISGEFKGRLKSETRNIEWIRREAIAENYERYKREHQALKEQRRADKEAYRSKWRLRDEERDEAWHGFAKSLSFEKDFADAAARPSKAKNEDARAARVEAVKAKLKRDRENDRKNRDRE